MNIVRNRNLILATDSYKLTQWQQYPPKTQRIVSYAAPRGSKLFPYVVNFGLQYYIREYLLGQVVNEEDIREADDIAAAHFNDPNRTVFNRDGWMRLVNEKGGVLPLEICGIDEGLRVPHKTPLFTLENTDDDYAWVTNPMETLLLKPWYTTTVATLSHFCLSKIGKYLIQSADDEYVSMFLKYMLQDFGARGVSSEESSILGGMAHLVNGRGTDTIQALRAIRDYYDADLKTTMPGHSVVAYEHSTVTTWPNETASYLNGYEKFPGKIISFVVDSYDQRNAIKNIFGGTLKYKVIEHAQGGGLTVTRLDSGNPLEEVPACIELLMDAFGYRINTKGFRELPPVIKILQGDGMNYQSIGDLCERLIERNLSIANLACLGMGGALLQKIDRDSCEFALKCCNIISDGEYRVVQKNPKTDPNKASHAGRLVVLREGGEIKTLTRQTKAAQLDPSNMLKRRLRDGVAYNSIKWSKVCQNVELEMGQV